MRAGLLLCVMAGLMVGGAVVALAQAPAPAALERTSIDIRGATFEAIRKRPDATGAAPLTPDSQTSEARWDKVRALPLHAKVEVDAVNGSEVKGRLQSVADDAIVVTTSAGGLRVLRTDVRRVRVPSLTKRLLYGTIGTITGQFVPLMACPYCENEGHSTTKGKFIFAGVGALMFLVPRTSTVYKMPAGNK